MNDGYSIEELREAHLDDFRVFLCELWAYLKLPKPTRVQLWIAYWIQYAPRRVILMAFRGVGKSYITVAFVLWSFLLDPQLKVMIVSANETTAAYFTTFCKQIIEGMPLLQHLKPRRGQRDSTLAFDVGPATPSKDPSLKSVGITGQLTGSRADIIVPDDVEIPKNSQTFLLRERLSELVKEFDSILKPGGRIIYLGTPQIEESLYRRLQERGYEACIIPSEVPKSVNQYHGRLSTLVMKMLENGDLPGTPVDPARFTRTELDEKLLSYGKAGYALQFMLDTSPQSKDASPLRLRDLIVYDCDDRMAPVEIAWGGSSKLAIQDLTAGGFDGDMYHGPSFISEEAVKYQQTVMAIDPSGRGKDETAFAILKYLNGVLYLVDIGGYVAGYEEDTLKGLATKALRWGVNDIIIERNYGGGMFDALLKPWLARVFAEEWAKANNGEFKNGAAGKIDEDWNAWSSTQKEMRICDTLQPVVESHRLVVHRRVIELDAVQQADNPQYSFIQQYTRIKREKGCLAHDDRVEALSMACAYLTEKMSRDQKRAHVQHQESLKDKMLEDFKRHVFSISGPPKKPNWTGGVRR